MVKLNEKYDVTGIGKFASDARIILNDIQTSVKIGCWLGVDSRRHWHNLIKLITALEKIEGDVTGILTRARNAGADDADEELFTLAVSLNSIVHLRKEAMQYQQVFENEYAPIMQARYWTNKFALIVMALVLLGLGLLKLGNYF